LQNGKESKPTYNYLAKNETNSRMDEIRDERKKAEITSTQTPLGQRCQKVMSTIIAAIMLQLLGYQLYFIKPEFIQTWR